MQAADLIEKPIKALEKGASFLFKVALVISSVIVGGIISTILLMIPFFSFWDVPTTWKWVPGALLGLGVALIEIKERRYIRGTAVVLFLSITAIVALQWYGIDHPHVTFDWPYQQTLSLLIIALIYFMIPIVLTVLLGLVGAEEILHFLFRKKGASKHH